MSSIPNIVAAVLCAALAAMQIETIVNGTASTAHYVGVSICIIAVLINLIALIDS